jgi:tetratricopeptide (TPR) repeat protein
VTKEKAYKPTMFDRHGPDAGDMMRAYSYGLVIFVMSVVVGGIMMMGGMIRVSLVNFVAIVGAAAVLGYGVVWLSTLITNAAGNAYKHLMVDGSSTPYKEQYSYQQALVMQGKLDEAIESYEAVIAEKPNAADACIKAAELYAREKSNPVRAAELFREVQRIPGVSIGDDVYAANRLIDLLNGPLNEPGRALVELRRMIEKYPGSAAASHARDAIAALKPAHMTKAGEG